MLHVAGHDAFFHEAFLSDSEDDAGDPDACSSPPSEPGTRPAHLRFGHHGLADVRRFVASTSRARGLPPARLADLVVAVNELATNTVCHGGGAGTVRMWEEGDSVVCEVSDAGHIAEALVGRRPPDAYGEDGRGLWMVHQLCDLVEMRSTAAGTVVRVHMSRS